MQIDRKFEMARGIAYPGDALTVTEGANEGDGLSVAENLCLGDAYELATDIRLSPVHTARLNLRQSGAKDQAGKPIARAGKTVLDCELTLMSETGRPVAGQVYATLDHQGCVSSTHLQTSCLLEPQTTYVLIDIAKGAQARLP